MDEKKPDQGQPANQTDQSTEKTVFQQDDSKPELKTDQPQQLEQPKESQPAQTPPPADTPPPSESDAQEPKKKKRSLIKLLLIIFGILILLFLLLAGAAYYYLQSQGLTPDKLNPEPQAPKTTIAPRNDTSNTYQNQNYKFSMPIEKEVKVKESPHGFGVTSMEMTSPETPEEYGPDFQMLVFPKALGAAINQDFEKYYSMPENSAQEIKDPSGAAVQFTKVKNRTVNNNRAFEFRSSSVPEDPDVESEIGVYIEIGTDTLVISTAESNRDKLEEMLSDFKYPLN